MFDNLLEEICECANDEFSLLLIEELKVHYDDWPVPIISTRHVDDASLQHLLNFRCVIDWYVDLSPVLILLQGLIGILNLEIFLMEKQHNFLVGYCGRVRQFLGNHVLLVLLQVFLLFFSEFRLSVEEESFVFMLLLFLC